MKRLSLQWRITLMTAALIGVTCVLMNCLIGYSGKRYMDAIGSGLSAYSEIESGAPDAFDPQSKQPDDELTIIISGRFCISPVFPAKGVAIRAESAYDMHMERNSPGGQ